MTIKSIQIMFNSKAERYYFKDDKDDPRDEGDPTEEPHNPREERNGI